MILHARDVGVLSSRRRHFHMMEKQLTYEQNQHWIAFIHSHISCTCPYLYLQTSKYCTIIWKGGLISQMHTFVAIRYPNKPFPNLPVTCKCFELGNIQKCL